jgi:hypothetical protein
MINADEDIAPVAQDPPIVDDQQPNEAEQPAPDLGENQIEPDNNNNPDPPPPNLPVNMAEAAPPAFALTPAVAHHDILDYSKPEPAKLFQAAVTPLEGNAYNGTPENLKGFLEQLQQKTADYTWLNTVLTIQVDAGPAVVNRNLIND